MKVDTRTITDRFSVSSQLTAADLPGIARAGFRSIICNRPDGEAPDQPTHDRIADAARANGIEMRYLPVTPGRITRADVAAFRDLLRDLPGPVLAYCRSGARSSDLWSRCQAAAGA